MTRSLLAARSALALLALLAVAACGGAPPPASTPAATPVQTVSRVPDVRPPFPTPARIEARHGGLVADASGLFVELVVEPGSVRVYLYDVTGAPLAPGADSPVSGRLIAHDEGGEPHEVRLEPPLAGTHPDATLSGDGAGLPERFRARIELSIGGELKTADVQYGSDAGAPDASPPPDAAASPAPTATP